jgi:hypothetical protein
MRRITSVWRRISKAHIDSVADRCRFAISQLTFGRATKRRETLTITILRNSHELCHGDVWD